jgi:carboxypeptidase D
MSLTLAIRVEYPLGVGYSADAIPAATSEEEIAQDFLIFFTKFQSIFGISDHKIYVTGESYAGRYVPYIADAMLQKNDTTYFDLTGILIYDPSIGQGPYQQGAAVIVPYVYQHANFFNFNDTYMTKLADSHSACGYADYLQKYLRFPPGPMQPAIAADATNSTDCDLWNEVYEEAYHPNPCFNPYSVNLQCPLLSDPLGFPTDLQYLYEGFGDAPYFDRADVKAAMHAPPNVTWSECTGLAFNLTNTTCTFGDCSLDSIQVVLPRVIEATNRVFIGGGEFDMELIANGILLAIQNMTWNGATGFQTEPSTPIYINLPDLQYQATFVESGFEGYDGPGQGYMGTQHYERGLLWGQTKACGHMQPQLQPRSSYRHLQWLLGKIETL